MFKLCSWTDHAGWELCSLEAFKPCDVLRPIKPDCAVEPLKQVMHFVNSSKLSSNQGLQLIKTDCAICGA